MPDTTNSPTTGVQPATQPATGVQPVSGVQPGVPFQDLTKWATKAPEGETLISTAYRDKVTDDLKFVENKPGVHKPDPILVADNVTRKFGGMTAVDVSHFEIERHGITALKQSLLDHIMALREEGTTVLFVEHDINMVRHIADWVTVMAEGKIVAEGQPKSVMNDPAVIDAYLGAHANVDLGDDSVLEDLKEA